jgi:hypothetical protein
MSAETSRNNTKETTGHVLDFQLHAKQNTPQLRTSKTVK